MCILSDEWILYVLINFFNIIFLSSSSSFSVRETLFMNVLKHSQLVEEKLFLRVRELLCVHNAYMLRASSTILNYFIQTFDY